MRLKSWRINRIDSLDTNSLLNSAKNSNDRQVKFKLKVERRVNYSVQNYETLLSRMHNEIRRN